MTNYIETIKTHLSKVQNCLVEMEKGTDTPKKPLLADAKVGWVCKRRDGKYVQIDGVPPDTLYFESSGILYYPEGNISLDREDLLDVISCEPLAPEHTPEWAWQMMLLGNKVTQGKTPSQRYYAIKDGYCAFHEYDGSEVCINTRRNHQEFIDHANCFPLFRWHTYTPDPPYKKGDWVEMENGKHLRVWKITAIPNQCDMILETQDGYHAGYYFFDGKPYRKMGSKIVRKLNPSEVILDFGAFKGTIKAPHVGAIQVWDVSGKCFCMVNLDTLIPNLRKQVEELLEAQEVENEEYTRS